MIKEDRHFRGGPRPGEAAPDFDLPTIAQGRVRLSEYRALGRPAAVWGNKSVLK
jgi:hypothetical protein